jgi:hypothetical protein
VLSTVISALAKPGRIIPSATAAVTESPNAVILLRNICNLLEIRLPHG